MTVNGKCRSCNTFCGLGHIRLLNREVTQFRVSHLDFESQHLLSRIILDRNLPCFSTRRLRIDLSDLDITFRIGSGIFIGITDRNTVGIQPIVFIEIHAQEPQGIARRRCGFLKFIIAAGKIFKFGNTIAAGRYRCRAELELSSGERIARHVRLENGYIHLLRIVHGNLTSDAFYGKDAGTGFRISDLILSFPVTEGCFNDPVGLRFIDSSLQTVLEPVGAIRILNCKCRLSSCAGSIGRIVPVFPSACRLMLQLHLNARERFAVQSRTERVKAFARQSQSV